MSFIVYLTQQIDGNRSINHYFLRGSFKSYKKRRRLYYQVRWIETFLTNLCSFVFWGGEYPTFGMEWIFLTKTYFQLNKTKLEFKYSAYLEKMWTIYKLFNLCYWFLPDSGEWNHVNKNRIPRVLYINTRA